MNLQQLFFYETTGDFPVIGSDGLFYVDKTNDNVYRYDVVGSSYVLLTSGGGGVSNFLGLTDTPGSYSGEAGKSLVVNSGETGLEFGDATSQKSNIFLLMGA